jgi:hypothetical protein
VDPQKITDTPAALQHDGDGQGPRTAGQVAKDVVLFFAAPFISIAYVALFPFIGLMLLVRTGGQPRQQ